MHRWIGITCQEIICRQTKFQLQAVEAMRCIYRNAESQRPDTMRSCMQQHGSFLEGFTHQFEIVVFQVAQSTVDQLAGRGRGGTGPVSLVYQSDMETAQCGIVGCPGAVDSTTTNQKIKMLLAEC